MENRPRKTRSDAKLEQLSPRQRERLHLWLEDENRSYAEVVDRLRSEFHLTVGKSAVALYWRRHLLPSRHAEESTIAAALAALPSGAFDAATLNQARALAWTALTRQVPQVQEAATLLQLLHRADRLAIARQRVALEERRLALREGSAPARQTAEPRLPLRSLGEGGPPSAPAAAGPELVAGQPLSPSHQAPEPEIEPNKRCPEPRDAPSAPARPEPPKLQTPEPIPQNPPPPESPSEHPSPKSADPRPETPAPISPAPEAPPPSFPGYSALLPPPAGAEPEALSKPSRDGASYRAPQRDITHGQPPTAPESAEQAAPQVAVPSAPARPQTAEPRLRLRSLGEGGAPLRSLGEGGPRPRPPALTQAPWA